LAADFENADKKLVWRGELFFAKKAQSPEKRRGTLKCKKKGVFPPVGFTFVSESV
jgi:hypothetical protein